MKNFCKLSQVLEKITITKTEAPTDNIARTYGYYLWYIQE